MWSADVFEANAPNNLLRKGEAFYTVYIFKIFCKRNVFKNAVVRNGGTGNKQRIRTGKRIRMNEQYQWIIFDADHTLINFDEDERRAFRTLFAWAGRACDENTVQDCWQFSLDNWGELGLYNVHTPFIQQNYHALYDNHVHDIVHYVDTVYGLNGKQQEGERVFTAALSKPSHPMAGAEELLTVLQKRYRLAVATNGLSYMQRGRLQSIERFFAQFFVSQEIGAIKPTPIFFQEILSRCKASPSQCLMVGDSIQSDILGAQNVNMEGVWFNPARAPRPDGVCFKGEIHTLKELLTIL